MSQNQGANSAQFPFLPPYMQPDAMRHRHAPGPPYHHQLMREQYRNAAPSMGAPINQHAQQYWILEAERTKYFSIKKSKKTQQHSALQDYKDGAHPKEKEEFQAKKLEPEEQLGVNEYFLETQKVPQNNEIAPMYPLYSGKYQRDELSVPEHTIHRRRSRSPSKTAKGVQIWELLPIKFPGGVRVPQIKHWVRDSEKDNEYPFSRLNIKAEIVPCFTDEEWSSTIVFLPGSAASPQELEKLSPEDQERQAIHEQAMSMQQIGWTYGETKRMWELLEQFELRFIIVADRLDGPLDRSVDEVKDRYYRVARKLLELRGDVSNPLMRVPRFNYEHEVERKKNLEMRLTWNSFEVAREEENLQTAKILNKEIKKEEKQIKSLQKLLKDQTKGSRHLGDLISIGNTLNFEDDYLSQNLGSEDSEDGSLSARRSKKRGGGSVKNKRINRERDRFDNITPIMSPTTGGRGGRRDRGSGAYLRSQKLFMGLPVTDEENELIEKMLQEMEINKEALTPTERICNQFDTLRREILVYMQLKREIDAKKEELQQIERSKQEAEEAKQRELQMHPPLMQQGSQQGSRRMSLSRQNSDKMMPNMPPYMPPPPMLARQSSGGNMEHLKRQHEMLMMQNGPPMQPMMGGMPGPHPNPLPPMNPGARMPPMMMPPFSHPHNMPPNIPMPMPPESTSGGSPSIAGSTHAQTGGPIPALNLRKSGTEGDAPVKKKPRK